MGSKRLIEAAAADEPVLRDLLQRAFDAQTRVIAPPEAYAWLGGRIAAQRVFYCGPADAPEGVLVFGAGNETRSLRIEMLAVSPHRQGQGIARFMVRAAIELAQQRGLDQLKLMTASKFDRLHTFYIEMGFNLVGYGPDPNGSDRIERAFFVRDL